MDLPITHRTVEDPRGHRRTFRYYLIVDVIDTGRFCFEDYGVRISEDDRYTAAVPSITTSAVRIDELLTLLADNCVGPAGLEDVLADWV